MEWKHVYQDSKFKIQFKFKLGQINLSNAISDKE